MALQTLIEGEQRQSERGLVVWLAALNPSVLEVVRASGLAERLGKDRMLFNARAVIERYQPCSDHTPAHRPPRPPEPRSPVQS